MGDPIVTILTVLLVIGCLELVLRLTMHNKKRYSPYQTDMMEGETTVPDSNSSLVARAMAFAAAYHQYQYDKNDVTYIWHPIRVAQALMNAGYGDVFQAGAVLHDTVEDTSATLEDIQRDFGDEVVEVVDAMTRRGHLDEDGRWEWEETNREYVVRCCQHPIARVIKKYDVYDNADPRRYCEGVPVKRYIWALDYIRNLEVEEQRLVGMQGSEI